MPVPDKHMNKITLSLSAGQTEDNYSFTPTAANFDFVYGASSEGLTPFELALADMEINQIKEFAISSEELGLFFGPLLMPFRQALNLHLLPGKLYLKAELLDCKELEAREIVKAMAKSVGHGNCGGSCGCGC